MPNRRGPAHPVARRLPVVVTSVTRRGFAHLHVLEEGLGTTIALMARSLLMHTIISCCGSLRSTTSKLLKYESPFCQRGSQPNFFASRSNLLLTLKLGRRTLSVTYRTRSISSPSTHCRDHQSPRAALAWAFSSLCSLRICSPLRKRVGQEDAFPLTERE